MTYPWHHATPLLLALSLLPGMSAAGQSTDSGLAATAGYDAIQIAGLPDAKPNIKGHLRVSGTELLFASPDFKSGIPFDRMTSVSIGDERVETGGKTGQVARTVIPFGGGLALATVTQKSVDLLTVEYRDLKGGYHGVVFLVPKSSAKVFSDRISPQLPASGLQTPPACAGGPSGSTSLVVEPIGVRGVEFPAEYRVLLYEGLINELRASTPATTYVRAGSADAGADCPAMRLTITVTGFKKGNRAVRASTGPVGMFVGKTSVSFHAELTAADGHSVLAEDMTNSKRMDTESLGLAKSVAKAVSKKMAKLPQNRAAS